MKTAAYALAAVLAFGGAAFAKDISGTGTNDANSIVMQPASGGATYKSKGFIDPNTTGSIATSPDEAGKRLGGGIDPSVLPNF